MLVVHTYSGVADVTAGVYQWFLDLVGSGVWSAKGSSDGVANVSFVANLLTSGGTGAFGFDNDTSWLRVGTSDGVYELILRGGGGDVLNVSLSYDSVQFTDLGFSPAGVHFPPATADGGYVHRILLSGYPAYTPLPGGPYDLETGVNDASPFSTYFTVSQGGAALFGLALQMVPNSHHRVVAYVLDPTPLIAVVAASPQESSDLGTVADWRVVQQLTDLPSGGGGGAADTTPPTISAFTPADGATVARAAASAVTIADETALRSVVIWATLADGTARLVYHDSAFQAGFLAGSSLAADAYTIAADAPGWATTAVTLTAQAIDTSGNLTESSATYTISDPPTGPVVGGFLPTTGSSTTRTASTRIDVTHAEGAAALQLVTVEATLSDDTVRVVYDGTGYAGAFAGSSVSSIANGHRLTFAHAAPGWVSTSLAFRVRALDVHGVLTVSTSYTLTVSDPPAPPTIGNFLPANDGTTTRAGTVRVDVTDDEGAAAIAFVALTVALSDGSERVVYEGAGANDFAGGLTAGSSRTSITGGYRYLLAFDGAGWPSASLAFTIRAEDAQGRASVATLSLTVSDPPALDDTTAPTVAIAPAGPELPPQQPIKVTVTDAGGLRRVIVRVRYASGLVEEAWDGVAFTPFFKTGSSVKTIIGGLELVVARTGGWPSSPTPDVVAIDAAGNEA